MLKKVKKWFVGEKKDQKPEVIQENSGPNFKSMLSIDQLTGREVFTKVEVSNVPFPETVRELPPLTCDRCGHEIKDLGYEHNKCKWCEKNSVSTHISKRMLKRLKRCEFLDEISPTDMAVYRHIMQTDDPFADDKFPKAVWNALYHRIDEIGDPCVDNLRLCDKDDKLQRLFFRIAQEDGCCGSETFEFEYRGKTYLLGFNYGH